MAAHDDTQLRQAIAPVFRAFRKWGIEKEDLQQEALVVWYQPATQAKLDQVDPEKFNGYARQVYHNGALAYAILEAKRKGFEPDDQYSYSMRVVRELLPLALEQDGATLLGQKEGGGKGAGLASEGGELMTMLADVKAGYASLTVEDQILITGVLNFGLERMAVFYEDVEDTVRKRFDRVCARLARSLGEISREHVGSRRVTTNATARVETERNYG